MGFSAQSPRAQTPRAEGTKTHRYRMNIVRSDCAALLPNSELMVEGGASLTLQELCW